MDFITKLALIGNTLGEFGAAIAFAFPDRLLPIVRSPNIRPLLLKTSTEIAKNEVGCVALRFLACGLISLSALSATELSYKTNSLPLYCCLFLYHVGACWVCTISRTTTPELTPAAFFHGALSLMFLRAVATQFAGPSSKKKSS